MGYGQRRIGFNSPFVSGNEKKYIDEVFENNHFSGNGPFTKRCQDWLEGYLGAKSVRLTHSCTAGLEMTAMLAGISPGDEVIMPSFTFVTTASAFMRNGAVPVFCEIDPESMLIEIKDIEHRIGPKTKAIVAVHYAGCSPDMDELGRLADSYGLMLIEDSAQGLGSKFKGKPLGTLSPLASISFHETKNIHSGLGGCLVVNDGDFSDMADIIWERGTNRTAFFKGTVDKYSWQEVGSSFYLSELQAAFLFAQLESLEENLKSRRKIWRNYSRAISPLEETGKVRILRPPENCESNSHMFAIVLNDGTAADNVRVKLNEVGVHAVIHYVPLHSSNMGSKLGYSPSDLPNTMVASSSLLRLPLHHEISDDDIEYISDALEDILSSF